jgi:hypothetical protein
MIWLARICVALAGLFSLAMGATAFLSPEQLGQTLGVGALTPLGLNSMRADFGSLFLASAIACGLALFARKPDWLLGAMTLYLIAVIGRVIGVAIDGAPADVAQPIIIELVLVAFLAFGARTLRRA